MVPGLSPPGSSVSANILVTGSRHGALQKSIEKSGACQLHLAMEHCSSAPEDQLWTQPGRQTHGWVQLMLASRKTQA